LEDADLMIGLTKCDGVMAARGLLENPGLFEGHVTTPWEIVEEYIENALGYGTTFFIFHHHLMVIFSLLSVYAR
jgi:tRNA-dihydrouridine synthase 4